MKKLIGACLLALSVAASAYATETCSKTDQRNQGELPSCIAIDAATSDTTSATIDTFGYIFVGAYIKADGPTTAVVDLECRGYSNTSTAISDQWHICAESVVNPDATNRSDQAITLSRAFQWRVKTRDHTVGAITVFVDRYTK